MPYDEETQLRIDVELIKKEQQEQDKKLDQILTMLGGCSQCKLDDAMHNKSTDDRLDKLEDKVADLWVVVLIARNPKISLIIIVALYVFAASGGLRELLKNIPF